MKNLVFLLAGLLMVCSLHAQEDQEYQIRASSSDGTRSDCKAIVIAPSGLKFRKRPDFKSTTIVVIPFGKEVSYGRDASLSQGVPMVYDADSIAGAWLRCSGGANMGTLFQGIGNGILKMDKPFYLLAEEGAWCRTIRIFLPITTITGFIRMQTPLLLSSKNSAPCFSVALNTA